MKEQDKATAGDLSEIDLINMPDREFKIMITKILTRLEKRVEGNTETLNTEIKNNQSEMKSTINKIINTLDAMNSSLEEATEQINDLENTVMKSK